MNHYLGIDLGGTNIAAGLVDEAGRMLHTRSIPTRQERGADDMIARMAELACDTAQAGGVSLHTLAGVGVGVPGPCDSINGIIRVAINLGIQNIPLAAQLGRLLDLPISIGNDADAAALGELTVGAAAGCDSALMITLGTGVGGGLIIDRKVFLGCGGEGTEPGHTILVMGGEPCACGARGCFEAYASATALIRQTRRAMQSAPDSAMWQACGGLPEHVNGATAFECAKGGDAAAQQVVRQYIEYLAAGIGSLVNIFRPACVILGGGVSNQKDYLLERLNDRLKKYCFGSDTLPPPPAVCATLGNDAGIIGAALFARR